MRPLIQATGAAHFNEVFFDNVRVPVANVLGEIDNGWPAARTVMANESAMIGGSGGRSTFANLLLLAQEFGRTDDPVVRQRLVDCYVRSGRSTCSPTASWVRSADASVRRSTRRSSSCRSRSTRPSPATSPSSSPVPPRSQTTTRSAAGSLRAAESLRHLDRWRHQRGAAQQPRRARARAPQGAQHRPRRRLERDTAGLTLKPR